MKELLERPKIFEVGEWVYVENPFIDELGTFVRHRLVQVDKRTKVGNAIYFWAGGIRYPLEHCRSSDFTDDDVADAVALIQSVSDEPGISQVRQMLAQLCPQEMKPKIWGQLSKADQEKIKPTSRGND